MDTIIPVSYTHLDVYKRQEMEYKLHCQDMEALLAKFDDDFSLVVDIHRKNYGKL